MRILLRLSSFLILFAWNYPVETHLGHDLSVPSGVWPKHEEVDEDAGLDDSPALAALAAGSTITDLRISSWQLSDGAMGASANTAIHNVVSDILADVYTVAYNNNYVFVRSSGIPSHSVGPFNNPSTPGWRCRRS